MARYEQSIAEIHVGYAHLVAQYGEDAPITKSYLESARKREDWAEPRAYKYGVHTNSTSAGWVRDYFPVGTLAEARERFSRWADAVGAARDDQTFATISMYDPRDNADESHGDYPLGLLSFGPRGGIVLNTNI